MERGGGMPVRVNSTLRALAPVCRLTESFWEFDDGTRKGYGHR